VDARGRILFVGRLERMPADLQARVTARQVFAFEVGVQAGFLVDGPLYRLAEDGLPETVRRILIATVALANEQRPVGQPEAPAQPAPPVAAAPPIAPPAPVAPAQPPVIAPSAPAVPQIIYRRVADGKANDTPRGTVPTTFRVYGVSFSVRVGTDGNRYLRVADNPLDIPMTGLPPGKKVRIPTRGRISIGRLATSQTGATYHIQVNQEQVSRDHAEIYLDEAGNVVVEDHSRNGTENDVGGAALTLPSTRAAAEWLGLDPNGAATELALATLLEGVIPQHFIPGFLKRHGTPTIHQRIGVGIIWGVAIIGLIASQLAFGADLSVALSAPAWSQLAAPLAGFWLGGAVGHFFYNALARIFGWKTLTVDSLGQRLLVSVDPARAGEIPDLPESIAVVRGQTAVIRSAIDRSGLVFRADGAGVWSQVAQFRRTLRAWHQRRRQHRHHDRPRRRHFGHLFHAGGNRHHADSGGRLRHNPLTGRPALLHCRLHR
jgi:hypothetical protein